MWRRLIYHPDINYALRQTLVLCLPVAVGLMLGELRFGLLFSLVPACCNIAGLDTPHKRFFKRLIIGASLFATCSLLTQLLLAKDVPLPFLLTGLTLVLGVTAELGPLHAKLLPASLLAAIFTLSLAGYMPVWEPLLIYALGSLWYGLFNWFWFWIWREQPLRESLSLLYRELADYCEAKYSLLTQHTDPEKALPPLLVRQLYNVGVLSMLIIVVSGVFIGMVLGLQGYLVLTTYSAETSLGMLVALSLLRELGPVVAALLFAGRAGSALTAEIGLMRATEQLSSMEMMAVDPLRRVISPRFWAGVISLPLLTVIFVAVGIWGGSLVGVSWKGIDSGFFWSAMQNAVDWRMDLVNCLIKSVVFAITVTWISLFNGYDAIPTSAGISRATTRTVVHSSLAVLGLDFVLTALMFGN